MEQRPTGIRQPMGNLSRARSCGKAERPCLAMAQHRRGGVWCGDDYDRERHGWLGMSTVTMVEKAIHKHTAQNNWPSTHVPSSIHSSFARHSASPSVPLVHRRLRRSPSRQPRRRRPACFRRVLTEMASTACFVIVSKNDIPVYEAEVGSAPKKEDQAYQHQFILHAALDVVQDLAWTTSAMFLKSVDRFNDLVVSVYVTAGHTRFMLLHDSRSEDGIKSFFQEVHELYIKPLPLVRQQLSTEISYIYRGEEERRS
ncbi:hypothetical protein GUJ93_ZPchr0006g43121 [Zizania palustris]|uniref:Trafficking protein particle complex subunit 2 n=1 Tax=Zizania palustris TaxID=103762 RepID=A0A8J5W1S9_ZIZPA|nr:hypothetical protein GUJ93_ZPchr0006g43121 [Zizania palustris]